MREAGIAIVLLLIVSCSGATENQSFAPELITSGKSIEATGDPLNSCSDEAPKWWTKNGDTDNNSFLVEMVPHLTAKHYIIKRSYSRDGSTSFQLRDIIQSETSIRLTASESGGRYYLKFSYINMCGIESRESETLTIKFNLDGSIKLTGECLYCHNPLHFPNDPMRIHF